MRKGQRKKIFQSFLETIMSEGGKNNYLIFTEPNSGKYIQFVTARGDKLLIIDIPKGLLNKEERKRLIDRFHPLLEEFDRSWQAEISLLQGSIIAESIFRDVFLLPDNYSFKTKLSLS